MTIREALYAAAAKLDSAGFETARLDAEVLLRDLLGLDRTGLFLKMGDPLTDLVGLAFDGLVGRRLTGESVAYITGRREFFGLEFAVGPGVLVPRPETELLVEWAIEWLKRNPARVVVDVGSGSGAIALSLAAEVPVVESGRIVAVEPSAEARRYVLANRERLGLADRVEVVEGDVLDGIEGPVDLVLANLPYLRPDQVKGNRMLAAEPEMALVSGDDGLDLIRRLVADLPRVLSPRGAVGIEMDPSQVETVRGLLAVTLPGAAIRVIKDLAGLDRHVVADLA